MNSNDTSKTRSTHHESPEGLKFVVHEQDVTLSCVASLEPIAEDVPCGSCTLCCQLMAPNLTPSEISSGKYPLSLTMQCCSDGPLVTMAKNPQTLGCAMFIDGKCSIYEDRPMACRQFDCRKGHGGQLIPNQLEGK